MARQESGIVAELELKLEGQEQYKSGKQQACDYRSSA